MKCLIVKLKAFRHLLFVLMWLELSGLGTMPDQGHHNTANSTSDMSWLEKPAKEPDSSNVKSPAVEDKVMATFNLSEGLILAKLCTLKWRI